MRPLIAWLVLNGGAVFVAVALAVSRFTPIGLGRQAEVSLGFDFDPPVVVGYVILEGASTAILNAVEGVDLSNIDAAGTFLLTQPRVRVRFKPKCEGRITDFSFELVDS